MKRSNRMIFLFVLSAAGLGIPSIISLTYSSKITDTVLAAFIALFGVIFTAIFSEVSSYYSDRGLGMQKKWELVFPLLQNYYNPWLQSAYIFSKYLKEIQNSSSFSTEQASRLLFYVSLFFSKRLKFSREAGGGPILAEDSDEAAVREAYDKVELALSWTELRKKRDEISYLQGLFLEKDSKKPWLSDQFIKDIDRNVRMKAIRNEILGWLTSERVANASAALDAFQESFKTGINKLYSGWA